MNRCSAIVFALVLLASGDVFAQQVAMGRFGQRYFTAGLSFQPGLVTHGDNAPEALGSLSATHGTFLVLGLHQAVTTTFTMSAELDLGLQWMDEHSVHPDANADSEKAFAYQMGVLGRYIPSEDLTGLTFGGGIHWFGAQLSGAPVQMLGVDVRVGWALWPKDLQFALIELGYSLPAISGVQVPTDFTGKRMITEQQWMWHRFTLSTQFSF